VGHLQLDDRTLIESGGFYAADVRSPAARLRYYAQVFPIVEVDATYYALPSEQNARLWVERTPPGFVFNIKAFGLLTQHPIDPRRLPDVVRERLPRDVLERGRLYHGGLPADVRELVWTMHIEALRPLAEVGKLGCLLFQFPAWFRKNRASVNYPRELRDRVAWPIAVEFRGGGWMEAERQNRTLKLLEDLGLAYVSVDEPQGFPSSTPPVVACTAQLAVLRLHGHNAELGEAEHHRRRAPSATSTPRTSCAAGSGRFERWPNRPSRCTAPVMRMYGRLFGSSCQRGGSFWREIR
jgi:uncharacterized protein YecE (DUF72 family)